MHFPPRDDDDEILAPADDDHTKARPTDSLASSGESTMFNWSEPALRSDRMCWSLIGTSYVLAYELGIFGTYSEGALATNGRVMRHGGSPEFNRRADRIERLLYVFIIQAAGRFGLPSMYGAVVNRFASANFEDSSLLGALEDKSIVAKKANIVVAKTSLPPQSVDKTQLLWVELMVIMQSCNDQLFTTKDQTAAIISSGDYVQILQRLQPRLHDWKRKFEVLEGNANCWKPW